MKNIKFVASILFVLLLSLSFFSCEKDEGTGGRASISGTVFNTDFSSNFESVVDAYNMPDVDVYIVYGDDETYSDKTNTNYNGSFKFEYLREGDYTIYVYSEDSSKNSPSEIIPIKVEVSLDKEENKDVGVVNIFNALDNDDGFASISGKIYKINYNATYTAIYEEYYSADEDVFIVYGDNPTYFDKTKTRADGSYSFNKLIKGDYRVFVFSEDVTQNSASNVVEISKDTIVSLRHQNIVLQDLIIAD